MHRLLAEPTQRTHTCCFSPWMSAAPRREAAVIQYKWMSALCYRTWNILSMFFHKPQLHRKSSIVLGNAWASLHCNPVGPQGKAPGHKGKGVILIS